MQAGSQSNLCLGPGFRVSFRAWCAHSKPMATDPVTAAGSRPGPTSRNTSLVPPPSMRVPGCSSPSFAASSSIWSPSFDRTMKWVGQAPVLPLSGAASRSRRVRAVDVAYGLTRCTAFRQLGRDTLLRKILDH